MFESIRTFEGFLKMLNESQSQRLLIFKPSSYDEMFDLGTTRWLPCRKFGEEYFYEMIAIGDFYIIQDFQKRPILLLHPNAQLLIDFDNHNYEGLDYYKKLQEYPEILEQIEIL